MPLGTDPGDGIIGLGTTLHGSVTGDVGMIQKIGIDGQEADEVDITTMNATDRYKKIITGLIDAKGATLDLVYESSTMAQVLDAVGGANEDWTITFPDGATFVVSGFVKKVGTTVPYETKITQSVILRFSGPPTYNAAS